MSAAAQGAERWFTERNLKSTLYRIDIEKHAHRKFYLSLKQNTANMNAKQQIEFNSDWISDYNHLEMSESRIISSNCLFTLADGLTRGLVDAGLAVTLQDQQTLG